MTSQELEFKDGNPGAVQYGNFINYYQFHPPNNRINLLPKDIWLSKTAHSYIPRDNTTLEDIKEPFVALDIGCNAGNLSFELVKFLKKQLPEGMALKLLAVDIDPVLIQRAQEQFSTSSIEFLQADCTQDEFPNQCKKFLNFYNKITFDAVFCFSTTMWIHLNKGDEGLLSFLRDISKLGECLVVEPQPWKCYKNAVKRMKGKVTFEHFKSLEITANVEHSIEKFIVNDLRMQKVHESDISAWKRKIYCFRHRFTT